MPNEEKMFRRNTDGTFSQFVELTNQGGSLDFGSSMNADTDSVDVPLQSKGSPISPVLTMLETDTTAMSDDIDMSGYNAMNVRVTVAGTGNFLVRIHGSTVLGGTYSYLQTAGFIPSSSAKDFVIPNLPRYCKIEVIRKTAAGAGQATVIVAAYGTHSTGKVRPNFEEYVLAINETVPANTNSSYFVINNTEWVRGIKMLVKSPTVAYQPFYRDVMSNNDESGDNTIGGAGAIANFWRPVALLSGSFVPTPFGLKICVKNTDASLPGLIQAHIILIGS